MNGYMEVLCVLVIGHMEVLGVLVNMTFGGTVCVGEWTF